MRRLIGVLILLAVTTGVWWWLRGELQLAPAHDSSSVLTTSAQAWELTTVGVDERVALATPDTAAERSAQTNGEPRVPVDVRPTDSMADDWCARVRCVDGAPLASLRVSLLRLDARGGEGAGEPLLETTDSAGRVCYSGVRARIASTPDAWILSHDLPAAEPPRSALDLSALEPGEFDARLPLGGRFEVLVRELDGAPAPDGSELRLRLAGKSTNEWRLVTVGGRAHFPWVELGREWEFAAWRPQGSAPTRARVHGPISPGQTAQVELVLGLDHPVVSFRAVDPSGRPLVTAALDLARRRPFGRVARAQVETDVYGRFVVDGASDLFDPGIFVVSHRSADGVLHQGRARTPVSPRVGWNDGGDVVMEPWPLLCAGIVLDPSGRAVARAEVVAGEDQGWLGSDSQVRGTTDADGRFELRGMWDSDEYPLRAHHDGLSSESVRARQGQEGVELVLAPRYSISGALSADEGVQLDALRFQLQGLEGPPFDVNRRGPRSLGAIGASGGWLGASRESDGANFELEPVRGGVYTLRVLLDATELARTEPFTLAEHLRLSAIDLRGRIHTCELALTGPDDPGALRGKAIWNLSGAAEPREIEFEGDRVRIQTPALPIDVVLLVRGHRSVRLSGVRERAEVKLEPALRVRIVLVTTGQLPAPPLAFGCDLRKGELSVGEPLGAHSFDPDNPEMSFECAALGKVEVGWRLERSFEGAGFGGAVGGGVLDGHRVEIDVRDEAAEQVFTVVLEGRLLDELRRTPPW